MNNFTEFKEIKFNVDSPFISNFLKNLSRKHIYLLLLMSLISILLDFYYVRACHSLKLYKLIIILNMITTVIFIIHMFKEQFNKMIEHQIINYFKFIYESSDHSLLACAHDFGNVIFAISSYMQFHDYDKAEQHVNALCSMIEPVYLQNLIGIPCLDNLLASKLKLMKISGIKFDIVNDLKMQISVDDVDLCAIVGNILDNAIEACIKVPEKQNRYINISFTNNHDFTEITISNSIADNKPVPLKTSKSNKALHGFGIANVKAILKKYHGTFSCDQFENYFTVTIKLYSKLNFFQTLKRILP